MCNCNGTSVTCLTHIFPTYLPGSFISPVTYCTVQKTNVMDVDERRRLGVSGAVMDARARTSVFSADLLALLVHAYPAATSLLLDQVQSLLTRMSLQIAVYGRITSWQHAYRRTCLIDIAAAADGRPAGRPAGGADVHNYVHILCYVRITVHGALIYTIRSGSSGS